jgi:hypothetical protein
VHNRADVDVVTKILGLAIGGSGGLFALGGLRDILHGVLNLLFFINE